MVEYLIIEVRRNKKKRCKEKKKRKKKGRSTLPNKHSYITIPKLHQSTVVKYPVRDSFGSFFCFKISGAIEFRKKKKKIDY